MSATLHLSVAQRFPGADPFALFAGRSLMGFVSSSGVHQRAPRHIAAVGNSVGVVLGSTALEG